MREPFVWVFKGHQPKSLPISFGGGSLTRSSSGEVRRRVPFFCAYFSRAQERALLANLPTRRKPSLQPPGPVVLGTPALHHLKRAEGPRGSAKGPIQVRVNMASCLFFGNDEFQPIESLESQSKPGTKMGYPQPCKELRMRPQLFLAGIVPCQPAFTF